jgi:LmbE family N-acetylglucosaminyl deacetylase
LRALAHAGISSERAVFLGYPDQKVAYRLRPLVADLRRWIIATCPEVVLTHAYEGGHPDHDSVAFAVHAAVAAVAQDDDSQAPTIIEFASYHATTEGVAYGTFLPADDSIEHTVQLTADGRALKRRLLACHRSQTHKWTGMHLDEERFRLAPVYDFSRPPHEGVALYEHRRLMTVEAWCALASTATEQPAQTGQTCVLK